MNNNLNFFQQFILNNDYIRLQILKGIERDGDLFNLMFTSMENKRLVLKSLGLMKIVSVNCNVRFQKNIIKDLPNIYHLKLISPSVDDLLQINQQVDILELGDCHEDLIKIPSKEVKDKLVKHLSNIVKIKIISLHPIIINLSDNLELNDLPVEYLKLDMNHIKIINMNSNFPFYTTNFLITKRFSNLKEISLIGAKVTDKILENLSKSSDQGLEMVSLYRCNQVTDIGILHFSETVIDLSIVDMCDISDRSIQSCFKLERLKIYGCDNVKGYCFKSIYKTLKYLNLEESIEYLRPLDNDTIDDHYKYFKDINEIEIKVLNEIENDWDKDCPYSHLKLITHITFEEPCILVDVLFNLSKIKKLLVSSYGSVYSDQGIKNLILNRNSNAGKIDSLYILKCHFITDKSMEYLSGHVKHLELNNLVITDQGIKYLNDIESITLNGCKYITDESLKYLSNLKKLELNECPLISEIGFSYLKNLNELTIYQDFPINAIKHLENIDKLKIWCWNNPIPHDLSKYLRKLKKIEEYQCNFLSKESRNYLKECGVVFI